MNKAAVNTHANSDVLRLNVENGRNRKTWDYLSSHHCVVWLFH